MIFEWLHLKTIETTSQNLQLVPPACRSIPRASGPSSLARQWRGANPHVYIAMPRYIRILHCKCWDMFFYLQETLENPISIMSWYFIQESERRSTSNMYEYMFNRFHWAIRKWFGVFILTLKLHCSKPNKYVPSRNQILFTIINVVTRSQGANFSVSTTPSVCHFWPDLPPLVPEAQCLYGWLLWHRVTFGLHTLNFTRFLQECWHDHPSPLTTHHKKQQSNHARVFPILQTGPQTKKKMEPRPLVCFTILSEILCFFGFLLAICCAWTLSKLVASPPSLTCQNLQ